MSTRRFAATMWPRGLLAAFSFAVSLAVAETVARRLAIDQRILTPSLFFQGADIEVHRISADPALHYELAPGTSCDCAIRPTGWSYRVTIDAHGARYPTHPLTKAPDVRRILCVGGSTMYGAAVDDEQTLPAALERQLNAGAAVHRHYEAWNLGTSAYMLRQAAHLAESRLDDIRPDLVLVQLYNGGRRAFLEPPSYDALDYSWAAVLADRSFFREQFAYPWWIPSPLSEPLLHRSALFRAVIGLLPGFGPNLHCDWCTRHDEDAARTLSSAAEARRIPVVYVAIPAMRGGPDSVYPGLSPDRFIDLYQAGREAAFYEVHPPPHVLEEYARLLIATLQARGLLEPGASPG